LLIKDTQAAAFPTTTSTAW